MVKISVIMATKNGENHITESIRSILGQTFNDFEFIICNDHSTDSTLNILENFRSKDKRIKILNNLEKPGFTHSLNMCIKNSRGKYIARMDDDDISIKNRLRVELDFLEKNPEVSIVGSNINYFDDNGLYGKSHFKEFPSKYDIWKGNIFAHPTVMIRKKDLDSVGPYNESEKVLRIEDYDYWCNFYCHGYQGVNLKECLLNYREDNNSFKKRNNSRRIKLFKCMDKWRKPLNIPVLHVIYELSELFKCIVPQKIIHIYHKMIFRTNQMKV